MEKLSLIKGNDQQPLNCNGQDLHLMLGSLYSLWSWQIKKQSFIQLLFYS